MLLIHQPDFQRLVQRHSSQSEYMTEHRERALVNEVASREQYRDER